MSAVVRAQDEILQVLYWMRGEGLGDAVPREQFARLLQVEASDLTVALERLTERGLVEQTDGGQWRLTPRGDPEGARRFREEFSPFLGKESHLSCTDPNCDCHASQSAADCVAHHHHSDHEH